MKHIITSLIIGISLLIATDLIIHKTDGSTESIPIGDIESITFGISVSCGTVTDIDGNIYQTVQIGDQCWMAENLKVTHYNDGSEIPNITNNGDWGGLLTGAYVDYDNDPTNSETYGRLYNWYTVDDSRGVCPEGWHVPSDDEWTILTNYLAPEGEDDEDGNSIAGGKMKECTDGSCPESEYWNSPNTGATNESGFTALPGGFREEYDGFYYYIGDEGDFWSSTEDGSSEAWSRELYYDSSENYRYYMSKNYGFSVRCIRD